MGAKVFEPGEGASGPTRGNVHNFGAYTHADQHSSSADADLYSDAATTYKHTDNAPGDSYTLSYVDADAHTDLYADPDRDPGVLRGYLRAK